ncbi:hypothetical protein ElyMa_005489600 [Elysia marginata]|uniref:Uncharacterized protein n=1 Tax=Elysia marginata TaxID=1093978 RepID=A0AAV4ESA0_9GAST|nr:hypothetical protein ElyMa_005489600 [Elysia marginata]
MLGIVSKHMVHGPCGSFNSRSPCMSDGKCTKRYPRTFLHETITGTDGYPLYRRRAPGSGFTMMLTRRVKGQTHYFKVDNRWIVPYSPLLLKVFNAHINVEFCSSVKSIKYICKYINKRSDQSVFGLEIIGAERDELARYECGRYIGANEAIWRLFGFTIH